MDGNKDVLGMYIGEHETAKFWMAVLNELRNRGVNDILICCVDNLTGFSEAISGAFPQTQIRISYIRFAPQYAMSHIRTLRR